MSASVPVSRPSTATSNDRLSPTQADEFPRRAGQTLVVAKRDNGIISPVQSNFSFEEEESSNRLSSLPDMMDDKGTTRLIDRGAPGDAALMAMVNRSQKDTELSKRKSQFYGEVFAYREPNLSTRDRIYKDSIVTAEVKTNVIIMDEYSFLTDLSHHLSQRYQRPTSSIFITLNHSACLLFAGTFDSAYILTVTALPSQLQPTTNKRNTALIQSHLTDALGVSPDRGIIRFVAIAEENLAINGTTILGEIENSSKVSSEENSRADIGSRDGKRSRSRRRQAPPKDLPLREKSQTRMREKDLISPLQSPPMPPIPTEKSALDRKAEKVQKMGRRRSFLSMFGK